jgi:hypothetical protein
MNKNKNINTLDSSETDLSLAFGNIEGKGDKKSKYLEVLKSRDVQFSHEAKAKNESFVNRKNAFQSLIKKDISSPDSINDSLKKGMKVEGAIDAVNIAGAVATGGPVLSLLLTEGIKSKILGLVIDDKKQDMSQQKDLPDEMPAFQRDHELSMELTPTYKY